MGSAKIDFSVKIVARFLRKENLSKMVRRTIKNPKEIQRKTLHEAQKIFLQNCRIKNLSPRTLKYYEEDLNYFFSRIQVKYVDEIVLEVYEAFLSGELEAGKKISSLNSRIRGLRVFFKFCADREYMEPFTVKLMKEDEEIKEPYTEAELARLLKKPRSNSWAEWRTWASINYLVATGNRASTVINLKIKDIDFEEMTIFLSRVKNRRQQIIPLRN
ncbi:MAG: tyrosine-type recombinase/integrase [Oscillospiraceae bacterium]|nr:tyrosine-type recombinase/integrase [Oscillospiraceae bacterium]